MAGHSQFKNIMHRKEAQDAKRAKKFTKLLREITVAAKSGGVDPETNPRLRNALFQARHANVPKDTIERAVNKANDTSDNYDSLYYEGRGPGNTALMIHVLTDNRNRSACDVRTALTRHGGSLADVGFLFQHVGCIDYAHVSCDELLEKSLDYDVLDVMSTGQGSRLICTMEGFYAVREALEAAFGPPTKAGLVWQPTLPHDVSGEALETLGKLLHALEDLDDVQAVWTNADACLESLQQEESGD